jgi:hypothetical protein
MQPKRALIILHELRRGNGMEWSWWTGLNYREELLGLHPERPLLGSEGLIPFMYAHNS